MHLTSIYLGMGIGFGIGGVVSAIVGGLDPVSAGLTGLFVSSASLLLMTAESRNQGASA